MFANKYPGTCTNPTCKVHVAANAGFTTKINNRYVVYCNKCVPQRIIAAPRRVLTTDGKIIMPFEAANVPLIKSLPGARWDAANKWWEVSLAMSDRRRVLEVADRIGLEVPPMLREIAVTEQAQNATNAGLYPFQVEGVNFLAHRDEALLGDEMGLGKSVQSLMSLPANATAMVICRAGLKYNWIQEVEKWRPDLKPVVINGSKNFRYPNKGEVVIVNSDILPKEFNTPTKNRGEEMKKYWERLDAYRTELAAKNPQIVTTTIIVDEAHDFRKKTAARTRKVREFCRLAKRKMGLTGSPLPNRPGDLYSVLDVLGMAKKVFGSYDRFIKLFHGSQADYGVEWGKPDPIVPELLRRVMLRRRRVEVLPDLPKETYTNMMVGEYDAKLKAALDALWEEWGTSMLLEKRLPPFEFFSEIRQALAASRVPAMLEYVENAEEQEVPLVVFSAHLAPMDALLGRPGWAVITGATSPQKRQEIVNAFQAGQLKGVGLTISAGGVGINLTHAWKALFVDLDWSPEANSQAAARLVRIGQKSNKVEIVRMFSDHVLDIHVHKLLVDKIDTIRKAIDSAVAGEKKVVTGPEEDETDAEFEARIGRILAQKAAFEQAEKVRIEAERKATAKGKVGMIHEREKARNGSPLLPLTPERTQSVRDAFKYMLSVCDAAVTRDNVGFNKPDAVVAHWLLTAGLETQQELEAGQLILTRYSRQLKGNYPILFSKVSETGSKISL